MMFAYPSRIADSWKPQLERVFLPEFEIPACTAVVVRGPGPTKTRGDLLPPAKGALDYLKGRIKRFLDRRLPASRSGPCLVYDSRWKDTENIAHVLHHVVSRVTLAGEALRSLGIQDHPISVILPRRASALPHKILGQLEIPVICSDGRVDGQSVSVECPIFYGMLPLLRTLSFGEPIVDLPRKIFISRRGSRTLLNEAEVERFLAGLGYTKVYFEDIPLLQQWSLMRTATDIVAIHGAGISAVAFSQTSRDVDSACKAPLRLTELFSPGFVVDCYRRYCATLGFQWVGVRGQVTSDIVRDIDQRNLNMSHAYASFRISIECLSEALEWHATSH
jgi:hypothetical protein